MRNVSPNSLKSLIKEALRAAKMEDAGFDSNFPEVPLPTSEDEVTDFIKKRTENYRRSWIIHPLEGALAKLEKKKIDHET